MEKALDEDGLKVLSVGVDEIPVDLKRDEDGDLISCTCVYCGVEPVPSRYDRDDGNHYARAVDIRVRNEAGDESSYEEGMWPIGDDCLKEANRLQAKHTHEGLLESLRAAEVFARAIELTDANRTLIARARVQIASLIDDQVFLGRIK
jgi:hypothetical protein